MRGGYLGLEEGMRWKSKLFLLGMDSKHIKRYHAFQHALLNPSRSHL